MINFLKIFLRFGLVLSSKADDILSFITENNKQK